MIQWIISRLPLFVHPEMSPRVPTLVLIYISRTTNPPPYISTSNLPLLIPAMSSSSSSSSRPKRMVGVSLKLYFTLSQTSSYIQSLIPLATNPSVELFIIPDFLSLSSAAALLSEAGSGIRLGAQDCFWEDEGAFTGPLTLLSLSPSSSKLHLF